MRKNRLLLLTALGGLACSSSAPSPPPPPPPPPPAPTIAITLVREAQSGTPVNPGSVSGSIQVVTSVDNAPAGATVDLLVDGVVVASGLPVAEAGAPVRGPQLVPSEVTLSVNTSEITNLTTGAVRFPNGPKTLKAVLFTRPPKAELASATRNVVFANTNTVSMTGPSGGGGLTWVGGDIQVTAVPVLYGSVDGPYTVRFQGTSASGPHPDFGGGPGSQSAPIGSPYNGVVLRSLNPNVETQTSMVATLHNGQGQTVATAAPVPLRLDNVAPRVSQTAGPPPTSSLGFEALQLTYATGSYPPGSLISLARINLGQRMGPHVGACLADHMHAAILILNTTSSQFEGPFSDPWTDGRNDACGHGVIVNSSHASITIRVTGSIVDPSLTSASMSVYKATGACDVGPTVDDVPAVVGTGPGQVSVQTVNLLPAAGNFDVSFNVLGGAGFTPQSFCLVLNGRDGATPNPNQTFVATPFQMVP
jgi:hypothetical protein